MAAELSFALHSAKHNFSMNSANCTSKLVGITFEGHPAAENFASQEDKTAALINGIIYYVTISLHKNLFAYEY